MKVPRHQSARRGAHARRGADLEAELTAAKKERPWADTWWEDGTETFDRVLLNRMTFAQARAVGATCRNEAPEKIAERCHEEFSRQWRLSWLPGARTQVGHQICRVADRFLGDRPSDTESIRAALDSAMTRRIALTYLAGLGLMSLGLAVGVAFSSNNTVGSAALLAGMFPGFLLIILVHNILGRRVFGSLISLYSLTKSTRFQRQLYSYGIRVAWRKAQRRHGSGTAS